MAMSALLLVQKKTPEVKEASNMPQTSVIALSQKVEPKPVPEATIKSGLRN